jgi:hypothetical protein
MRTYKREFLDEMNLVIPWTELLALIGNACASGQDRAAIVSCIGDVAHLPAAAVIRALGPGHA